MKKVYCDISATTPINNDVAELMLNIQKNVFGNPSSIHKYGQESHAIIEKARIQVATTLGCHQEEIIFTGCGSESNNIAIKGIIKPKSHIISSSYEHPSVMNVLRSLEQQGNTITFIKPDKLGQINPQLIEKK
jgi:cysteine desulfurase